MSLWRGIRWSTGWLFLPLIVVAAYAGAVSEQGFSGDYRLTAVSQAWVCLVVVGPLLAAWAAWDSARLRPWLHSSFGGAHRGKALTRTLAPAVSGTVVAVLVIVVWVAGPPGSGTGWAVTAAAVLTLVAAAFFGAGLGMVVPRLIATPLAIAATYGALGVAVANPGGWPARGVLTGVVAPCCASTEQVSLGSLAAVGLACCLLIAGGWAAITMTVGQALRAVVLSAAVALATCTAWALGHAIGPYGQLVARSTTTMVCSTDPAGPDVCIWPEHVDQLPMIRQTLAHGERAARNAGLDLPDRWSEAHAATAIYFLWASEATQAEHRYALSIDIAHWAGCTQPALEDDVGVYLALDMGVSPTDLAARSPELGDTAEELNRMNQHDRRSWLSERLQECTR